MYRNKQFIEALFVLSKMTLQANFNLRDTCIKFRFNYYYYCQYYYCDRISPGKEDVTQINWLSFLWVLVVVPIGFHSLREGSFTFFRPLWFVLFLFWLLLLNFRLVYFVFAFLRFFWITCSQGEVLKWSYIINYHFCQLIF